MKHANENLVLCEQGSYLMVNGELSLQTVSTEGNYGKQWIYLILCRLKRKPRYFKVLFFRQMKQDRFKQQRIVNIVYYLEIQFN